jgi:septal ring factor EnvC (AmiA/AmiB activator)
MDPQTPQDQTAGTGAQPATQGDDKWNIPAAVMEKYPQLVELIKKTESMSDEEREYWFQILPIMTEDQVTRLRGILDEEKEQLQKLDAQYQDELSKLNKKHLEEWDSFEKQKEREARKAAEASHEAEEQKAEENILAELENIDADPGAGL